MDSKSGLFESFFVGGFECSTHRLKTGKRLDEIAFTQHDRFALQDYRRLHSQGIRTARDGLRWHLVEAERGRYDFSSALPQIRAAQDTGTQVIWDLCHYGWPDWLDIYEPQFITSFARFAREFARLWKNETDDVLFVTPINEISFFSWAAGEVGIFNPFSIKRGNELKELLVRAAIAAIEELWNVDSRTRLVAIDPIINVLPADPNNARQAKTAESYRAAQYEAWDMLSGRLKPGLGGNEKYLDLIGGSYYVHNQWIHGASFINQNDPRYKPLRDILREVYDRYERPLFIAETGIEDALRPIWFRYVCQEAFAAIQGGVRLEGICLYPIVNHPGWDDDRHCHNGLWDYPDENGEREIYQPLANELQYQRRRFSMLSDPAQSPASDNATTAGVIAAPPSDTVEQTNIPRPEYPRPHFVRDEWLNLNGEWEFAFDDDEVGVNEYWFDGRKLPLKITVPFAYQTELSGINDKTVHECVWYGRSFTIPENWTQDVLLNFGAVDFEATVWINGQEVGQHQGGHVPFQFEIKPYLVENQNRLVVRVVDRQDQHQPRGKQSHTGLPYGIDYYCTTGIWQTVWLESAPAVRIEELRMIPDAAGNSFAIDVFLHAPSSAWRIDIDVFDQENLVAHSSRLTAIATGHFELHLPYAKLWTPESPHLYDLRVRLYDRDALLDEVRSYVGLRDIELRNGKFLLNGEVCYLKLVLDQGYWPDGYLTAPSDEALQTDIGWARMFGFNGVRKHQKIEDPRWLYWCDRLGLLVWEEMPNAREWSLHAEELLSSEWQRAVRRDYNHPCIIAWVPVNESMGFPGLTHEHPAQYAYIERMVRVTRRLDPTRPVVDNDGWEHTDITDICAIHDYTPTAKKLKVRYRETIGGGALPIKVWISDRPLFVRGAQYRGQPIVLSEVGGFLLVPPDVPKEKLDVLYEFYDSFKTPQELLLKYRDLMRGIAALPFLAGYCYTQLTDIEQEINGLLTYDRRPKVPPEKIAEIHHRIFKQNS